MSDTDEQYIPETLADVRAWYAAGVNYLDGTDRGEGQREFDRWLAEHDREVAAKTLRDAADEVRREARWAYEQQMRGRAVRPVERLNVVEQVLRDRAALIEAGDPDAR